MQHRAAQAVRRGLRRLSRDSSGTVALMFGLLVIPLTGAVGLAIDFGRVYSVMARSQTALDAAALAAGRVAQIEKVETLAKASAAATAFFDQAKPTDVISANLQFSPNSLQTEFTVTATAWVRTPFLSVLYILNHQVADADAPAICHGNRYACIKAVSTATAVLQVGGDSQSNVEVSLILDLTGSMCAGGAQPCTSSSKIDPLKAAAKDLIDIVVWNDQSEYTSKVALVPYSQAVNVGAYATQARGPIAAPKVITAATKTNPVVVTADAHGFSNGDIVYITGVSGMTQLNNREFTVSNKTTNTFRLSGVNGTGYSTYASGGDAFCTTVGCQYFRFINAQDNQKRHTVSTCATERTGAHKYTDAAPSTVLLGLNYPGPTNLCLASTILPLTNDKVSLKSSIDGLQAAGSTGGHIGVAWGWYMLAPNFGYIWPAVSQPAPYSDTQVINSKGLPKLKKIAVLMTDGEYNSAYCNGVISQDSTTGSGSAAEKIACNSPNGHAFDQAQSQCANMKAAGVEVFTVGFDIVDDQRARDLVNNCATDASHVYLASTGDALKQAFRDIALKISTLRLTN
jgi:Flp pilus assembly protein TadG